MLDYYGLRESLVTLATKGYAITVVGHSLGAGEQPLFYLVTSCPHNIYPLYIWTIPCLTYSFTLGAGNDFIFNPCYFLSSGSCRIIYTPLTISPCCPDNLLNIHPSITHSRSRYCGHGGSRIKQHLGQVKGKGNRKVKPIPLPALVHPTPRALVHCIISAIRALVRMCSGDSLCLSSGDLSRPVRSLSTRHFVCIHRQF